MLAGLAPLAEIEDEVLIEGKRPPDPTSDSSVTNGRPRFESDFTLHHQRLFSFFKVLYFTMNDSFL
jgi:hypothetical protein